MKVSWVAAIIESFYYNGRVQADEKKMNRDDFTELSRVALGPIMRATYYDELKAGNNPATYFSGSIVTDCFPIEQKGRYRVIQFDPDAAALRLPRGSGILRIYPSMVEVDNETCEKEETDEDFDSDFHRGEPGQESTFGAADLLDDLGEAFYVPVGTTARLFGHEDAKFGVVDYIKNDEELDLPEDVCWQVINTVLGPLLKVAGFPVDATDNSNPNVTTFKQRLDQPQPL